MTDAELVERARKGDAAAFGELVVLHGTAVYRAALAALGSPAEAEDVAQEALVQAFSNIAKFRGDASVRTWLVTIAWRRALHHRRSLLRRLRLVGHRSETFANEPSAETPSLEETLIAGEFETQVKRIIRALPKRLRDPLLLASTERYTYRELAVILEIPDGTVKWRMSEARRVIKEKLVRLGYLP